jgi:hypothetical protein
MGKQAVVIRLEVTRFPHYPLKRWSDARLPPSFRAISVAELIHQPVSTILDFTHRKYP